ncbi:MAG: heterodisulfide reductase [Planctomycetes bacterium]|nr:heterodisulfide reductase [Planctomycetota bacterium]
MPLKISKETADERLRQKVKEISGETFQKCYQCGTCSGSCPMTEQMTASPRKVMALLQLGLKETLEDVNTAWVCASCHLCMVRCPRGIDITKVMESIRQLKLRQNEDQINPSEICKKDTEKLPQVAMVSGFRKLTS